MADFMYLIRGGAPEERKLSPEEMQKHMEKWGVWMKGLGEKGNFKAGEPLESGGKCMRAPDKVVTDGPYAETKDLVGGYIIVSAKDMDEAVELAKGCPIFEDGGNLSPDAQPILEIREIKKMEM